MFAFIFALVFVCLRFLFYFTSIFVFVFVRSFLFSLSFLFWSLLFLFFFFFLFDFLILLIYLYYQDNSTAITRITIKGLQRAWVDIYFLGYFFYYYLAILLLIILKTGNVWKFFMSQERLLCDPHIFYSKISFRGEKLTRLSFCRNFLVLWITTCTRKLTLLAKRQLPGRNANCILII
jgi:hypothetical protein